LSADQLERIAVVGASLAGLEAAAELRRAGFSGELVVLGAEPHMPYDRPPLSKELLAGSFGVEQVALSRGPAVDAVWRLGSPVTRLDAERLTLDVDGAVEQYDGIVVATGATPVRPRFSPHGRPVPAGVHVVRTLDDCLDLAQELHAGPRRLLVVGGGFIGAEVASTACTLGVDVTVVEALSTPMQRALGHEVGQLLGEVQRDHGVDLRTGTTLRNLHGEPRVELAELSDGTRLAVDVVVLAVGVRPATGWLENSGLTLDDGVVCDPTCLAAPGVVAAGDVARWPNERYGEVRRVEHWDNAIRQGKHAARRLLAGDDPAGHAPYAPVPWVWSDQFGSKLQVLGSPAMHDELVLLRDRDSAPRWVALYRRDDRLVGVAALNSAPTAVRARRLLDQGASWSDALAAFDGADVRTTRERQPT
jgi:3-phenylpropionate/trans-cinnamate dioxygenase ferredoxin reductase subunit